MELLLEEFCGRFPFVEDFVEGSLILLLLVIFCQLDKYFDFEKQV